MKIPKSTCNGYSRWLLPLIGLSAFASLVVLYLIDQAAYFAVMRAVIKLPVREIFADWEWIPSSIECWRKGVQVYVDNTCYFWPGLGFNYSPLWLRFTFLPAGHIGAMSTSVALIVSFFLSLATLRPPRSIGELILFVFVMLSSATALLIERANADLLMFLLVIGAANAGLYALPVRLFGYGLLIFAGLLKFYPYAGLAIALRERITVVLLIVAASVGSVLVLFAAYRPELAIVAQNLPRPSFFTLQFGAADLPRGIGVFIAKALLKFWGSDVESVNKVRAVVYFCLLPVITVAVGLIALIFARRAALSNTIKCLSERESVFLVIGASVLCGCFFAGQSTLYRGVYWILVLPSLSKLARNYPHVWGRLTYSAACGLIVFVLWMPLWEWTLGRLGLARPPVYQPSEVFSSTAEAPFGIVLWLCNELSWWFLIAVLLSTAGTCLFAANPLASLAKPRSPPAWRIPASSGFSEVIRRK